MKGMRMQKLLKTAVFSLFVLAAGAAEKSMDDSWKVNQWGGYKPYPKLERSAEGIHLGKAEGKSGAGLNSRKQIPAKAGDRAVFRAQVKGTGSLVFRTQNYTEKGKWLSVGPNSNKVQLTPEWKDIRLTVPVKNQKQGDIGRISGFIAVGRGGELWMRDSSISVEKSEFSGDFRFPREWMMFAPVPKDLQAPLDRIPDTLGGVAGKKVVLTGNMIEFKDVFPEHKLHNCAWLYGEINAARAGEYTVGAGADYFMAFYVNGKPVIDTRKSGNITSEFHYSNFTAPVQLKAGKNILAVQFLSGSSKNPKISLGGAEDLRNMGAIIRSVSEFQRDDYEKPGARPGNPKLFRGILTDGMENKTTQALYSRGSEITFPGRKYQLPGKTGDNLFMSGIRIHKIEGTGSLEMTGAGGMSLVIERKQAGSNFIMSVKKNGKTLKSTDLPESTFPNNLIFAQSATTFYANALSIQDSRLRSVSGSAELDHTKEFTAGIKVDFPSVAVDEYFTGIGKREVKSQSVPFKIDLAPEFDPVKAGWKLAFSDEFNGKEIDWEKTWSGRPWGEPPKPYNTDHATLKDGMLHIKCVWKKTPKGKRPYTGRSSGLFSQQRFGYGYYEARLRFTRKPGWWASFWLCEEGHNAITGGGWEVDIIEDYSRRRNPRVVASNLHYKAGSVRRSYGYHFNLNRGLDDFYVIGCKWTPFEISFYMDGKLIRTTARHSPYQSMTYDAINHALAQTKVYICLQGPAGVSGGTAKEETSEEFLVDYVRYYEMPTHDLPQVRWKQLPKRSTVKTGEKFVLEVEAEPGSTGSKVKTAYLFDGGSLLDYKTKPPYRFEFAIDRNHYANTAWDAVGRRGQRPVLDGYPHFFTVAVQDEAGKVGQTGPFPVICDMAGGKPYKGQPFKVPGSFNPGHYDIGGQNVASYYLPLHGVIASKKDNLLSRKKLALRHGGSWVNYTISADREGNYDMTLKRSKWRIYRSMRCMVLIDGCYIGDLTAEPNQPDAVLKDVKLTAGEHTVTLITACNYGTWGDVLSFTLR